MSKHPTFPNPTVVEATCRIDFEPSPQSGWQVSRPTEFLQAVASDYPNVEMGPPVSLIMGIGPSGASPRILPVPHQQLTLSNDNRTRYLIIGDRHFVFGHYVPYLGWEKFREYLTAGWQNLMRFAKPQVITRISLRYVNLIPRSAEYSKLSDWLKPTDTIPATLIKSKGDPFVFRLESWVEEKSLLMITIGLSQPPGTLCPIVFDIDRVSTVSTPPDTDPLMKHIDSLHEDVWREFESTHTKQLKEHLERKS